MSTVWLTFTRIQSPRTAPSTWRSTDVGRRKAPPRLCLKCAASGTASKLESEAFLHTCSQYYPILGDSNKDAANQVDRPFSDHALGAFRALTSSRNHWDGSARVYWLRGLARPLEGSTRAASGSAVYLCAVRMPYACLSPLLRRRGLLYFVMRATWTAELSRGVRSFGRGMYEAIPGRCPRRQP
jgi:hypothetical protein